MLKREIVDQEREYKNQISALETRSHEQWVHIINLIFMFHLQISARAIHGRLLFIL